MLIVDVETTGIDSQKHSIASVGALDFGEPQSQFYQECRIWEGAEVTLQALRINGFSEEELHNAKKKTLEEVIREFLGWSISAEEKTIAGENPSFDIDFLTASAKRYRIGWPFGYRTIDLHSLCYSHYLRRGLVPPIKEGKSDLNLDKILDYVGLPPEPQPHNALMGAKLEAEAFCRLIYGRSLCAEFQNYLIPHHLR